MDYNKSTDQIEMTVHVFLDDLELSMRQAGFPELNLGQDDQIPYAADSVGRFLKEHVQLSMDDQVIPWNWIGLELSDDYQAFWCYMESEQLTKTNEPLDIYFDLLMDVHSDQKNIVAFVDASGREQFGMCTPKEPIYSFTY